MKKLLAVTLIIAIIATIGYDFAKGNEMLFGHGRHKCGGSWVQSTRNASWSYCDNCGEWHEFK